VPLLPSFIPSRYFFCMTYQSMSIPNIITQSKFQTRVIRTKKRIIHILQQLERPYFDLWQIMGDTRLDSLAKCALDYRFHLNQKTLRQIVAAYLYYAQPALGLCKTSYDLLRDFGLPREKFMKILAFVKQSGIVLYEDRFVPPPQSITAIGHV